MTTKHARAVQRWAKISLHIIAKNLQKVRLIVWPPHHLLWLCISHFEGGVHSINPNGHYGMLQMTYSWLGFIRGRASDYSQRIQEWAAEKAYQHNGYSISFLYGQWFNWDGASGACLKYR